MPRPSSKHPTQVELEILQVLWAQGPSTVRQVHSELSKLRPRAYTSILTLLSIMARKGYVRVRKTPDGNIYTAKTTQQQTAVGMLRDLVRRAFRGSTVAAVLSLLDEKELDTEELAYLKKMIDRKTKREAR